jgi:hypothetical protein
MQDSRHSNGLGRLTVLTQIVHVDALSRFDAQAFGDE